MDRSRYVVKEIPAEKVKTKRQVPPDNWEIIYGSYRETSGYVFFLLTKQDMAIGSDLNRRFRRQNRYLKQKDYLKYKTLKNDNKNYESCNAQKKSGCNYTSIFFHLIFSLNIIQDL